MPELREKLNINTEEIKNLVGEELRQVLVTLAQGAVSDIRNFAYGISKNMIEAQQEPDKAKREALTEELKSQLRGLAEQNRLRLNNEAWASFERAFNFGFALLDRVLANAILAI